MNILLISGSTRINSRTQYLTNSVGKQLENSGASVKYYNPCALPLPLADPSYHSNPICHPNRDVSNLAQAAQDASGFVLSSPIYHNSYSGVIKNTLDHLSMTEFRYKPIALASHGGDRSPQAVDQLRTVCRGLLGVSTPTPICTRESDYEISENDEVISIVNQDIIERISRMSLELIAFSHALGNIR